MATTKKASSAASKPVTKTKTAAAPAKPKALAAAKPAKAAALPKTPAAVKTPKATVAKPAKTIAATAKKSDTKAKPAVKRASPKSVAKPVITTEQRANYIEVAAFYISQRHGFTPSKAVDDWLQAEAEIDQLLGDGRLGG